MSWLPWSNSSSNPDTLSSKPENAEDSGNNALKAEASVLINTSSSDLPQPSDLAAHKTAEDVKAAEIEEAQSVYFDYSRTQRLGLAPYPRVVLTMVTAGGYGLMSGFYGGFNLASLKYLALNAHRLPKTKGGWYFYHKRKNYVVMREAFQVGFKTAAKYGIVSASYIGLEAYIDYARGTIDAFSTITAATVFGAGYAFFNRLSRVQAVTSVRSFLVFGAATGLAQDGLRYARGNDVWYLPQRLKGDLSSIEDKPLTA